MPNEKITTKSVAILGGLFFSISPFISSNCSYNLDTFQNHKNKINIWNSSVSVNPFNIPSYSETNTLNVNNISLDAKTLNNSHKLDEIASLKNNWNDNGAPEISLAIINNMRLLIFKLSIQPEIFPTAASSLQLEYDKADGAYLEIELTKTLAKVFVMTADDEESTSSIKPNAASINKVVQKFYE